MKPAKESLLLCDELRRGDIEEINGAASEESVRAVMAARQAAIQGFCRDRETRATAGCKSRSGTTKMITIATTTANQTPLAQQLTAT
jgi:hypothetical protein